MKSHIHIYKYMCKVRDHKIFNELARGNGYRVKANLKWRAKLFELVKLKTCSFAMLVKYSRWIVSVDPWNFRARPCRCTICTSVNGGLLSVSLLTVTTKTFVKEHRPRSFGKLRPSCLIHTSSGSNERILYLRSWRIVASRYLLENLKYEIYKIWLTFQSLNERIHKSPKII